MTIDPDIQKAAEEAAGAIDCNATGQEFEWIVSPIARALQAERDSNAAQLADVVSRMGADVYALEAMRASLVGMLHKLGKTTALLIQNAHGCAVNHYGEDYAAHGMPGWISDCEADLAAARAFLAKEGR